MKARPTNKTVRVYVNFEDGGLLHPLKGRKGFTLGGLNDDENSKHQHCDPASPEKENG